MKKFSLLALAAFSLFTYPMLASETEDTTKEPVSVETFSTRASVTDKETQESFIACPCKSGEEQENSFSYLALSNDEEEENTASA